MPPANPGTIERKLRDVQELPAAEAQAFIGEGTSDGGEPESASET